MNIEDIRDKILSQLDAHLEIGIAICDWDNLNILYENELFAKWFPQNEGQSVLASRIPNAIGDIIKDMLSKKRYYNVEHEYKDGSRHKVLKITFSKVSDVPASEILVSITDYTKEKELDYMIDSYARMAEKSKKDLEKAYRVIEEKSIRMERELEIAKHVQLSMQPFNFDPKNKKVEFAALLKPAKEVGGDFFDIFYIDDNNLCICLADVSDKGAGSALFMAASKTLIKANATSPESVAAIVTEVNNQLARNNTENMFANLFLGILNLSTGMLTYSNCGQCYPLFLDNDKIRSLRQINGPAVGIMENYNYTDQQIKLYKDQLILIFSDGVTESMNKSGGVYGEDKLVILLSTLKDKPKPQEILNRIFESVVAFEQDTEQTDDITLMTIKYLG